jgi:hypothetical protein
VAGEAGDGVTARAGEFCEFCGESIDEAEARRYNADQDGTHLSSSHPVAHIIVIAREQAELRAVLGGGEAMAVPSEADWRAASIDTMARSVDILERIAVALEQLASTVNPERMGGKVEHDAFVRVGTYDLGSDPR